MPIDMAFELGKQAFICRLHSYLKICRWSSQGKDYYSTDYRTT